MQHSNEYILDSAYLLPYFKTVLKGVHTILLHIIPACTALYSTHRCIEWNRGISRAKTVQHDTLNRLYLAATCSNLSSHQCIYYVNLLVWPFFILLNFYWSPNVACRSIKDTWYTVIQRYNTPFASPNVKRIPLLMSISVVTCVTALFSRLSDFRFRQC